MRCFATIVVATVATSVKCRAATARFAMAILASGIGIALVLRARTIMTAFMEFASNS